MHIDGDPAQVDALRAAVEKVTPPEAPTASTPAAGEPPVGPPASASAASETSPGAAPAAAFHPSTAAEDRALEEALQAQLAQAKMVSCTVFNLMGKGIAKARDNARIEQAVAENSAELFDALMQFCTVWEIPLEVMFGPKFMSTAALAGVGFNIYRAATDGPPIPYASLSGATKAAG